MYPCPFCDGFELRNERLAVFVLLPAGPMWEHYLSIIRVLSARDLVVFSHGQAVPDDIVAALAARDIPVVQAPVVRLEHDDGVLKAVHTADGQVTERTAGFVGGVPIAPAVDPTALGLTVADNMVGWSLPETEPTGATTVPGLYVVGDARSGFGGITAAVAQGAECARVIVFEEAHERWHV